MYCSVPSSTAYSFKHNSLDTLALGRKVRISLGDIGPWPRVLAGERGGGDAPYRCCTTRVRRKIQGGVTRNGFGMSTFFHLELEPSVTSP